MFCVCVSAGYLLYISFPVNHGPGITAQNAPRITPLTWHEPFTYKGATVEPRKVIEAEVRILNKERYYFDAFSGYSPSDVIVGWNKMSDERNISYIFFTLSGRSFESRYTKAPIDDKIIRAESDLWHLIPSTSAIDDKIKQLRNGHIIRIKGLLVDMNNDSGFNIKTSTTLSDRINKTGYAIWVEEFQVL
ncbi:MAG TPA: hypothetical protein DD671_12515 [Balneolaceae bacterium]|nr:hypothetical protein [Balneola sp.]HBQ60409.1 hypothetical protein [Balneolaceae bacterium]|tara:strand:+ start:18567 stop:19136 length:570 start_codon:yes stop_codon:yes gene_type:complete